LALHKRAKSQKKAAAKKRKYDSADSRKRIKEAALELFSQKGFKATTTREIAKKAQANVCLIKHYFSGKEGLFNAILVEFVENRRTQQLPYPIQSSLKQEIVTYLIFIAERTPAQLMMARMMFAQVLTDPSAAKDLEHVIVPHGDPRLLHRLLESQEKGICPPDVDIQDLAHVVSTLLIGIMTSSHILFPQAHVNTRMDIEAVSRWLKL